MQPETHIDAAMMKECDVRIAEIYARCNAEQPNFGVSEEAFSASIQKTASKYLLNAAGEPATSKELNDFLDQIQAEDLFMEPGFVCKIHRSQIKADNRRRCIGFT